MKIVGDVAFEKYRFEIFVSMRSCRHSKRPVGNLQTKMTPRSTTSSSIVCLGYATVPVLLDRVVATVVRAEHDLDATPEALSALSGMKASRRVQHPTATTVSSLQSITTKASQAARSRK